MFALCLQSTIHALENVYTKISESIHPHIFTQRSKTFTNSPSQKLWVLQARPLISPSIDVMRCESFWEQNAISVQTAIWQLFITYMNCNVNMPKLKTQQANYKTYLEREKSVAFLMVMTVASCTQQLQLNRMFFLNFLVVGIFIIKCSVNVLQNIYKIFLQCCCNI